MNEKYINCKIEELDEISIILMLISDNMFSSPRVSIGAKGTYFLSGESIIAAENTIKTIDFCCQRGYFADAYTLARKYRDDLIQYVFLSNIISNIHGLTEDEINNMCGSKIDENNLLKMLEKEFEILCNGLRKNSVEIAVELWMYNDLEDKEHYKERKKYFDASKYITNLAQNQIIKEMYDKYLKDIWCKVDRVLNNYVHTNGLKYVQDNYSVCRNHEQIKANLIEVVQDITSIFISLLAITDPTKLQSSDYKDAIELDIKPEEGSQYWVMPIVVGYMDNHFGRIHKDLVDFIVHNNCYGMKFKSEDYR